MKKAEFIITFIIEALLFASAFIAFKMCFFDYKGNFAIDDPVIVIIGTLLILIIIFSMWYFAKSFIKSIQVDAFFKKNRTNTGKLIKYIHEEENRHTTTTLTRVGSSMIPITTTHTIPEAFYAEIECRTPEGVNYLAQYEINKVDFKKSKPGDLITIKEDWEPWAYEII